VRQHSDDSIDDGFDKPWRVQVSREGRTQRVLSTNEAPEEENRPDMSCFAMNLAGTRNLIRPASLVMQVFNAIDNVRAHSAVTGLRPSPSSVPTPNLGQSENMLLDESRTSTV